MPSFFGYVGFVVFVPVCLALVVTLPAKLSGSIDEPFADMDRSHKSRINHVRIRRFLGKFVVVSDHGLIRFRRSGPPNRCGSDCELGLWVRKPTRV